jgi:hypothetical protein
VARRIPDKVTREEHLKQALEAAWRALGYDRVVRDVRNGDLLAFRGEAVSRLSEDQAEAGRALLQEELFRLWGEWEREKKREELEGRERKARELARQEAERKAREEVERRKNHGMTLVSHCKYDGFVRVDLSKEQVLEADRKIQDDRNYVRPCPRCGDSLRVAGNVRTA